MPFRLTEKQLEARRLLAGPQRHTLVKGGSRSGKTFLLTRAAIIRALRFPGSRHAILRRTGRAARDSLWLDTIPTVQRVCFPGMPFHYKESDGYILVPGKGQLWVGGLDDKERIERILGREFATIYLNECSQIPWSTVPLVMTRLAQNIEGLKQRAWYDINPVSKGHWTYRQFNKLIDPESLKPLKNPDDYRWMRINPEDNRQNLTPEYITSLDLLPARQRSRFFLGEDVDDSEGQLWTLETLEAGRVDPADLPEMRSIVVAIDPSGNRGDFDITSDEIGLCVVGLGVNKHGYILEEATGAYSPEKWGSLACDLYRKWQADRIIGETNYGGDMVRATVHAVDRNVPFKMVTATRGKTVRAEPCAALYSMGKVHHAGTFQKLENELQEFTTHGYVGDRSPNAADAAVWGITELMVDQFPMGIFDHVQKQAQELELAKDLGKVEMAAETPRCPNCNSMVLVMIGNTDRRCGQCGKQWSIVPAKDGKVKSFPTFLNK